MSKKEEFKASTIDAVIPCKLTYNCDSEGLQFDSSTLPVIPLEVDRVTQIVYMNCSGVLTPYLGPNGKPCRFTENKEIEEIR